MVRLRLRRLQWRLVQVFGPWPIPDLTRDTDEAATLICSAPHYCTGSTRPHCIGPHLGTVTASSQYLTRALTLLQGHTYNDHSAICYAMS